MEGSTSAEQVLIYQLYPSQALAENLLLLLFKVSNDITVCTYSTCILLSLSLPVPINATIRRMPSANMLSTGINLTLICTIQLNTAVDTDVVVNTSWTGPTAMFTSNNQGRISVIRLTESFPLYETRVFFSPLNITDSGTYVCQADVRPDPSSPFIVMNRDNATHIINVEGECYRTVLPQ